MFRNIPASESGLNFNNTIIESPNFNILNFHYIYNGGGVGVGDFDQNGLSDLVFSGNQVESKIFLNQGNLRFKDISIPSYFETHGWNTGVSIADINADGLPDIYLSIGGLGCENTCENQLFINQGNDENGIPQFKEKAKEYGLSDGLYTQQTAFFDYDFDGDLDAYILHNVIDNRDKNVPSDKKFINEKSKDQLLENRFSDSLGHAVFIDVSEDKGIVNRGYGLGITINDFNEDGRPDIYVANDFLSEDLLYFSKLKKSGECYFEEVSKAVLKHQSYNAMGVDAADINGDARPDIVVLDMLPEVNERRKSMLGFMNYDKFRLSQRQGYAPQFIRNTLQVNNGGNAFVMLPFSETSYYSGISATDWSWTPLLADFDNDGDNDLYVTNGYGKDITDLDFINYNAENNAFGTKEEVMRQIYQQVNAMNNIEIPNYYFENKGDLKFEDKSKANTEQIPSISNGAVYVDLDNDGDLDIVSNNINQEAFLLENQSKNANNWLKIKLVGKEKNSSLFGAIVTLWSAGKAQKMYNSPVRGYLSSVSDVLHFGLGDVQKVDSVEIFYGRTDRVQKVFDIEVNQTLRIEKQKESEYMEQEMLPATLLQQISLFDYKHKENPYEDYDTQPLLIRQNSQQGPCIAAANINGTGGDELFIGGTKGIAGRIYTQDKAGNWNYQELPNKESEDTDATFFDADDDGDLDLYVVSGGSEFMSKDEALNDHLYLNEGGGNFIDSSDKLAQQTVSSSCVIPFKGSSDLELLFVVGRIVPGDFPSIPESQLLVPFQGRYFSNASKFVTGLKDVGIASDAVATDFDNDEKTDLIVVGEWMQPTFFKGNGDYLTKQVIKFLTPEGTEFSPTGMWNSIVNADFDRDGDMDFIIGNQGENTRLQATVKEPLTLYTGDYDENGSKDPLIAQYYPNKNGDRNSYPVHSRDDVVKQLVKVKAEFRTYADFGEASFAEILSKDTNNYLTINTLQSCYFENKGDNTFMVHPLPTAAQLAPINSILVCDIDKDDNKDILLTGNNYGAESNGGWQDAFNGLYLKGDGKGNFKTLSTLESGFYVPGDGRDIVRMEDGKGNEIFVVGQNSGELLFFENKKKSEAFKIAW